jgi:thiol-disulfide isomerase/thioredoxin
MNLKKFTLKGTIKNNYSGYLYFDYEDKEDSCLVTNNQFIFKGIIKREVVVGRFHLKENMSMMSNEFYLENKNIEIELMVEQRKIKEYDVTNFLILSVKGTQTSMIQNDFNMFVKQNQFDIDYDNKLYRKLNEIVTKYPKNIYLSKLIANLSIDEKSDKNKLIQIYNKQDKKSQDLDYIKYIENNLYPERSLKVESSVFNFKLPNQKNKPFNTLSLEGKWFLIDFWASWCNPCRKQIPELKKIYDLYKNKGFEIVGVSIDKSKPNWINALDKENLEWINVNENKDFLGEVVKKYSVFAVPSNFLINSTGKIIAKDIEPQDLEKVLKENLKN